MSKSKGNVIDPFEELQQFGSDGLRYYLLSNSTLQTDGGEADKTCTHSIIAIKCMTTAGRSSNSISRV